MKPRGELYKSNHPHPIIGFLPCQTWGISLRSFWFYCSSTRSFLWVPHRPWILPPTSTNVKSISSTEIAPLVPSTSMVITSPHCHKLMECDILNAIPSAGMGGNHIHGYKFLRIWRHGYSPGSPWWDKCRSKPKVGFMIVCPPF